VNSTSVSRRRFVKTVALGTAFSTVPVTVFVDRTTPTGFYTVAIKILDLTEG
jgi:hypothetical protein